MDSKKVIVIGSGIAGLAAAIRLAVQGFAVEVYEKNNEPGGKLTAFEKNGFKFDAGPSLFTQPKNIEELFSLAQESIENFFTYSPVNITCKYFFENGITINAYTDVEKFEQEIIDNTVQEKGSIKKYLAESKKVYDKIGSIFLNNSLHKGRTWLNKKIIGALAATKLSYIFKTLNKHNYSRFSSPELQQIFNRYATYNGSNPYRAPGMLSLIPHLEFTEGTYYPKGGMISISNTLYQLAIKKGVQFFFNSPVQHIIHTEGKVNGVVINGQNKYANIVISNADVFFTYKNLLKNNFKANKILKQQRSSSALVFYWGINKIFSQLQLHNIFFSKDYKNEFDNLFKHKQLSNDPTIYINITAKMESGHAPAGKENWFVMVNAPENNGQDWEEIKTATRKNIIEKLNRILQTDIEPLIEFEEILDPVIIETKTGSYAGSLYGTSSNSAIAAFLRHANFTATIEGLYFCGGSVHPGGGIPLCLSSAKITTDLVVKKYT
jgi:phytoene desaturase